MQSSVTLYPPQPRKELIRGSYQHLHAVLWSTEFCAGCADDGGCMQAASV